MLSNETFAIAKAFRMGTHRLISPEQTLIQVSRFLPIMGITRIANVTGLDRIGVPVVMVCRPNSRSLAVSQGKGLTLAAAKASGVMESIESYHAEHIMLPLRLASHEEIRYQQRIIDVVQLAHTPSTEVLSAHQPLLWIEGYDLLQEEPVWLPFASVHCNLSQPQPAEARYIPVDSNGLASGNHLLEAISHGLCEVVERDATTLWEIGSDEERELTRLDLATVDDPACCEVLEKCQHAGIFVAVWEITSDIGLPVFSCQIIDQVTDPLHLLYAAGGQGCHPTRHIALLRALTEAVQSRLAMIAGSRDDLFRHEYEHQLHIDTLASHRAFMMRSPHGPMRRFQDAPSRENDTFDEDIAWELRCLHAVGIERVIAVDLTKSEFGLPVVRVVIPGLEGPTEHSTNYVYGARGRARMEQP